MMLGKFSKIIISLQNLSGFVKNPIKFSYLLLIIQRDFLNCQSNFLQEIVLQFRFYYVKVNNNELRNIK